MWSTCLLLSDTQIYQRCYLTSLLSSSVRNIIWNVKHVPIDVWYPDISQILPLLPSFVRNKIWNAVWYPDILKMLPHLSLVKLGKKHYMECEACAYWCLIPRYITDITSLAKLCKKHNMECEAYSCWCLIPRYTTYISPLLLCSVRNIIWNVKHMALDVWYPDISQILTLFCQAL